MTYTKTLNAKCLGGHMDPLRGEIKERCFKCAYPRCRNCDNCQNPDCREFAYPEEIK